MNINRRNALAIAAVAATGTVTASGNDSQKLSNVKNDNVRAFKVNEKGHLALINKNHISTVEFGAPSSGNETLIVRMVGGPMIWIPNKQEQTEFLKWYREKAYTPEEEEAMRQHLIHLGYG